MGSTNVIKKLVACAILIAPCAAIADPAVPDTIFLECNVSGVWQGASGEEILRPATVTVEIYQSTNYLSIMVDGPNDYIVSVSTKQNPGRTSISNLTSEGQYYLSNAYRGNGEFKESDTSITINRVTGLLTVNYRFFRHNGRHSRTNYSGSCKKVNNQKKF